MNKKGKLYLASKYTYELIVPDDSVIINIARKPMRDSRVSEQIIELAPSKELFSWYMDNKESEDWFIEYKRRYKKEVQGNERALARMRDIKKLLDSGKDVVLLCYCRDVYKCHRSIVGEAYEYVGIEVIYK